MFPRFRSLLAVAAIALAAAPAAAAPVSAPVPPQGRALLLIPLTLTKVQDLSFGTLIPSTTSAGFVTINAVTGVRTTSVSLTPVATDVGQRGRFAGAGSAGQQVIMTLTPATELTNPAGDIITVLSMSLDGPTTRTIAANQTFFVGVGGVLYIEANQPEGVYTSTYDLTADYQ